MDEEKKIPTCSNSALLKARNVSVQTDLQSRTLKDQGPGPSPKDLFFCAVPFNSSGIVYIFITRFKKKNFLHKCADDLLLDTT